MRLIHFLSFFILIIYASCQAELVPDRLVLKGFLGQEELIQAKQTLESLQSKNQQHLIIEINSSSGDLNQVLEIAKIIYELKVLKQLAVIVYLDDTVVGPSAMLPFLADELYCSLFVSWGDIPLGSEESLPTNILRNRVGSLINDSHPHAAILHVLADAMCDAHLQVIDEHGWKITRQTKDINHSMISALGQTLVINQNQLKELGLVTEILTPQEFHALYHLKEKATQVSQSNLEETTILVPRTQTIMDRLTASIHFNLQGPNSIGYLYVGDHETAISQSTWLYIKKGLDYYKKNPPCFIILELNTPGGEVFAAQKISDALKEIDTQFSIPIVVFINNWAISAGAMLAYSCRFITTAKDGSMGAAEPVYAGESGKLETASEKVNSALRADFANRARFFDRNPLIAEAMVDKDMILVLRNGHVTKLDQENQIKSTGPHPDLVISPKGKLLTLDANQMMEYGVADLLLPPEKLVSITLEEKSQGHWPASKMLLFQAPFFSRIPQATIDAYRMDWKTRFFVFLTTPLISSLLFMGLIIGAYMELSNPGLSLPGSLAAICLFLIIISSFALEIANWLELILLVTGLALLLVELFLLPTFGLFGFVGLILFIIGLFSMMVPGINSVGFEYDTKTLNAAGKFFLNRLAWLCGALILSLGIIAYLARYLTPNLMGFKRFILTGHEQEASLGYVAGESPENLPLIGSVGEALTTLRPSGKIAIQDRIYDAVSTGELIEAGEAITVVRLEGSVIIVNCLRGLEPK